MTATVLLLMRSTKDGGKVVASCKCFDFHMWAKFETSKVKLKMKLLLENFHLNMVY